MHYLKRLKISSHYRIILLVLLIIVYVVINIKYFNKTTINEKQTFFEGKVISKKIDGDYLQLEVKNKETIIASYYIKNEEEKNYLENNLVLGSKIKINGTFNKPTNNTIPNIFNYKKYLNNRKIYLIMNTTDYKIRKECNIFYKIKNSIIKKLKKKKNYVYYELFVLGNKNHLDNKMYEIYNNNGISHIFAISGMHLGLLIVVLKKLKLNNKLITTILLFYGFLVSFTSSVCRVIIFHFLKNNRFTKHLDNITLLLITASILIIYNPFVIFDVGFEYSFIITLGLIILKPKNIIDLSIKAFLISAPISIYYNYEINLLSILNNIIIVPFISFIFFPLILISVILSFISPIINIMILIIEKYNIFSDKFSINIIVGKPYLILIIIYYFCLFKYKTKYAIILLIIITKLLLIVDSSCYVYFLDVGQGDCSIIISPFKRKIIMIDTGGKIEYEKESWQIRNKKVNQGDTILTFLKSLGARKIDTLILSHGDFDHIGNAKYLLNNYKINKVIFNNDSFNDLELNLIKILDSKNIKYYQNIKEININNNKINIFNSKLYNNENDNSNVIYFNYLETKILLMGDAGIKVEEDIISKYNLKDIDILKVGHHGSSTSTSKAFIDTINPKYSIISVGKNNRYGHPNNEVLNNIEKSKIYRTDINGSIIFEISKNKCLIERGIGEK